MSDRNHPHANGRSEPADLPVGELADWWDRRATDRRSGSIDRPSPVVTVAFVAQLDALARADELSAPRPGFLDHLERQIMQTPQAMLPTRIPVRQPKPLPTIPFARPHRRNRGLVDILTVAAVLALLLGGSWSVFNDRANAPTPGVQNGVAGVSTPDDSPTSTLQGNQIVALNQPWVETMPDVAINGVQPVSTTECVTPSREAGSVEASVRQRRDLGDAAPTIEPEFLAGPRINPYNYPPGNDVDVEAMTSFFRQFSACRFDTGDHDGTQLLPYTGAWWNLWADEAFSFDQATQVDRDVDEVVQEEYSFQSSYVYGWSYTATVLDVRQVPPDGEGHPRLLVTTTGSNTYVAKTTSLMVQEDGQWRILIADVASGVYGSPVAAFVVDIVLGADGSSPRISGNYNGQIEADFPVAMTIANVGDTPRRVSVAGQDLGIVVPGGAIIVQPFRVRPEAVDEADGYFIFEIEAAGQGASPDGPVAQPVPIAVYAAGSLPYGPVEAGRATPAPVDGTEATPAPNVIEIAATPLSTPSTETLVAVATAAEPNRVIEIDQPWASSTGTELVEGVAPVSSSDCATPPRPSGAILDLVAAASVRPTADLPADGAAQDIDGLLGNLPEGSDADRQAGQEFLDQLSACRFQTGSSELPIEDRYTGPFWSLFSDDFLLRSVPDGEGRTPESLVRQFRLQLMVPAVGSYPGQLTDVRIFPPDARRQERLLIAHRNVTTGGTSAVSLLVREQGTWRLAEVLVPVPAASPESSDSSEANRSAVRTIDFDVAIPNSVSLNERILTDVPIAITLTNSGSGPSSVLIGDQDLGVMDPGETIHVVPFVLPSADSLDLLPNRQLTVTASDSTGEPIETAWTVLTWNERFPNGTP